ncbi:hypothetical protein RA210_U290002 [Rubrivivax sp. A210]|nr:hypothetical protein RA210_U290002 [Rubrivivax sp. A210]
MYIFCGSGLASCRWRQLTSNVRPHRNRLRRTTIFNSQAALAPALKCMPLRVNPHWHLWQYPGACTQFLP